MKWYKSLDINTKINLKELSPLIIGVKFSDLNGIFSFKEKINILYVKLKLEGADI